MKCVFAPIKGHAEVVWGTQHITAAPPNLLWVSGCAVLFPCGCGASQCPLHHLCPAKIPSSWMEATAPCCRSMDSAPDRSIRQKFLFLFRRNRPFHTLTYCSGEQKENRRKIKEISYCFSQRSDEHRYCACILKESSGNLQENTWAALFVLHKQFSSCSFVLTATRNTLSFKYLTAHGLSGSNNCQKYQSLGFFFPPVKTQLVFESHPTALIPRCVSPTSFSGQRVFNSKHKPFFTSNQ